MSVMNSLPVDADMPIEVAMLAKQVEGAQRKVEGNNFAVRRNVISFDDVMNRQREIIYTQRDRVLKGEDMKPVMKVFCEKLFALNPASVGAVPDDGFYYVAK